MRQWASWQLGSRKGQSAIWNIANAQLDTGKRLLQSGIVAMGQSAQGQMRKGKWQMEHAKNGKMGEIAQLCTMAKWD